MLVVGQPIFRDVAYKYVKGTVVKLLTVKQDVDVTNKYCRDVTEERSITS